ESDRRVRPSTQPRGCRDRTTRSALMTRTAFETDKLLVWLGYLLKRAEAVDVDIVGVDRIDSRSSVQITLRDVPVPAGGFEGRPPCWRRARPRLPPGAARPCPRS